MFRRLPDPAATIVFDFEGTTFEAWGLVILLYNSGGPRGCWTGSFHVAPGEV